MQVRSIFMYVFVLFLATPLATQAQQVSKMQKFYLATIDMQGTQLPFQMSVTLIYYAPDNLIPYSFTLINGDENISGMIMPSAHRDTFTCVMPVFNTAIIFTTTKEAQVFNGYFIDYSRTGNYTLPFSARMLPDDQEDTRFVCARETPPTVNVHGRYTAVFYDNGVPDSTVGIFEQTGKYLRGTFLTTTGDYRFLSGNVCGNRMYLSAFDGSHVFLFEGEVQADSTILGHFYSGSHFHATFTARRNPLAKLPDDTKLTYLKPGYDKIDFRFPDMQGNMVSLSDAQFVNKPVIITITGSWCPNCMDETSYLSEVEEKYADSDLEIIALSFERKTDTASFTAAVNKVREHFGTDFIYLNAGLPKTASDALPMLNKVMGFPTMILLDRNHRVVSIHTGFSGPATGKLFLEFQKKFEMELEQAMRK